MSKCKYGIDHAQQSCYSCLQDAFQHLKAENEELKAELNELQIELDLLANQQVYRGNSVSYIYDKQKIQYRICR